MSVDQLRIQGQNKHSYQSGAVLYWMNRDMRIRDNWALLHAQEIAHEHKAELIVCYNLDPSFLGGTLRQLDFKIHGLKELKKDFEKKNIAFHILVDSEIECVIDFIQKHKVGEVVTDFAPLTIQRNWLKIIVKKVNVPVSVVDTHNIVPIWEASNKKEFAAYTLRTKINKKLKDFLTKIPKVKKQSQRETPFQKIDFEKLYKDKNLNTEIKPVDWCRAGERAAHKTLKRFIAERAPEYHFKRNDPTEDVQSDLSPYLHYGMISSQTIAIEIKKARIPFDARETFLEELIVRKELADNFCYYEKDYDNPKGFHEFFINEHKRISKVKREYLYSLNEFEEAHTHDELWNACQIQMVQTGKMHGYMRMYWAKMIFAWTKDVKEAMKVAIYLNDKYELDGRDPNGYAGIAWCIGGVHDRPWFTINPVFGKVRYMSRNGMKKKFDVELYISKWLNKSLF